MIKVVTPFVPTKNATFPPFPANSSLAGLESCIVDPLTPSSIAATSEYVAVVVTPFVVDVS